MDAKGTIHYLSGYERNVGTGQDTTETVTKYYRALGRLIAFRRGTSLYWVGTDHLGSTARVANSAFSPIAQVRYLPYGSARDNVDDAITDDLYTSQKWDASVGLYWFASRAYDPSLGRFTCPDTIVPSAGKPQSLNRYAYCANNPLKYVDPSGHRALLSEDMDEGQADSGSSEREDDEPVDVPDSAKQPGMGDVHVAEGVWSDPNGNSPAVPQRVDIVPCSVPEQPSLNDVLIGAMSYTARNGQIKVPDVVMTASTPVPTAVPINAPPAPDIIGGMGLNKPDALVSRGIDAATATGEPPESRGIMVGGLAGGGIINGVTQRAFDQAQPGLTEEQRLQRMEVATGIGIASTGASGWAASRAVGLGRAGPIGIALAVGYTLDAVKEWIFDVGGLQPGR